METNPNYSNPFSLSSTQTPSKQQPQQTHIPGVRQLPNQPIYLIGEINPKQHQLTLLQHGLNYIPTHKILDKTQLEINEMRHPINNLIRNLIVEQQQQQNPTEPKLKTVSVPYEFTTKFIDDIANHYVTLKNNTPSTHNISQTQKNAINQLKRNPNIVIKPVDKNLGVALIHTKTYLNLAHSQHLNDKLTYTLLNANPLTHTVETITNTLKRLHNNGQLRKTEYKRLLPKPHSTPGAFYILPKLHKTKLESRPIVSNVNHPTKSISKYLHDQLNHTATQAKSYLSNSCTLIDELKHINTTKTTYIITADIKSLYTNIPNTDGIKTVCDAIHNDTTNPTRLKNRSTLSTLLNLVLTHNIFTFNHNYYQQINGTAMGTIMAPTYANVYLRHKEENNLKNWLTPESSASNVLLFKRYIDDILIIYNNHNNTLTQFLHDLRTAYAPLELTIIIKRHNTTYLDLSLTIDDTTNKINHEMYVKPTNSKTYIPNHSLHTTQTLHNTIYNDLLRANRLCNNLSEIHTHQTRILAGAVRQGYSLRLFKQLRSKAKYKMLQLTDPTTKPQEKKHKCFLTLTHNGLVTDRLVEYIKKRWHETANKNTKLIIGARSNANYQQILVRSHAPTRSSTQHRLNHSTTHSNNTTAPNN